MPLPWSGDEPPYGFGAGRPWLPQPPECKDHTVEAQTGDPGSMLELYRSAIYAAGRAGFYGECHGTR